MAYVVVDRSAGRHFLIAYTVVERAAGRHLSLGYVLVGWLAPLTGSCSGRLVDTLGRRVWLIVHGKVRFHNKSADLSICE